MPWRSHEYHAYHACSYILWMEQTKDLCKLRYFSKIKNESNRYQIKTLSFYTCVCHHSKIAFRISDRHYDALE